MRDIELMPGLIERLNPVCHEALQAAAVACVSHGHREVAVEHLLVPLLTQPGADCRLIVQHCDADPDRIKNAVEGAFARFRTGDGASPRYSTLVCELLQDAWMVASVLLGEGQIRSGAILLAILSDLGRYARFDYGLRLEQLPLSHIRGQFDEIVKCSVETPVIATAAAAPQVLGHAQDAGTALGRYGHDFTEAARQGRIDPVFCRDDEIRQIVEILARRRKNNPLCVGEAGVGKTAVVEGLALRIVQGDVPDFLVGASLYGLDLGALQAGASVKGEFERRLKAVLDEVKAADRPMIVFIDEAHTLIGAGGPQGGSDGANLLKPALARGEIRAIAATTWSEYKKYFEKDSALVRRFQLVQLAEPGIEQARIILGGLVPAYEKAHGVFISSAGVAAAAALSARYVSGRQLPDKAIDLLDTACARVKASASGIPHRIDVLRREELMLAHEAEALNRDINAGHPSGMFGERLSQIGERRIAIAAQIDRLSGEHDIQRRLAGELVALRSARATAETRTAMERLRAEFGRVRETEPLVALEVGVDEVASVVSDWTGIPVAAMTQDEAFRLTTLGRRIKDAIRGQDHAIDLIVEQLQTARLDLHKAGRPIGVFLLVGPSGVGKTETAVQVARLLFGSERFLTTINMTEYQERHTLSRLIGSPPGYVGYGEGGVLTEAIRKTPYSVVLLDEVEKADINVLNLFYQAFDKGELNDGEGRAIDCRNVVFFLTSNLAADEISQLAAQTGQGVRVPEILERIRPRLAEHFKPALLARMQPLVYLPLSDEAMGEIVSAKLAELGEILRARQGVVLHVSAEAEAHMRRQCLVATSGARLVDEVIQRRLLPEISRAILQAGLDHVVLVSTTVDIGEGDGFRFAFETVVAP
ncbi:type VI secretion system ATPase TssH [Methylobacterium fujisawaense]|uniref:type VI secretion system ATPase TssH n=1 Tax=Methylobacterium fujisawaense TaxID=107400 RepID=UPI00313D76BF